MGCRTRASASELLRVVAEDGVSAVPDPRRRCSGRGAWLHPDPACLRLAERRRAFPRALRVRAPLDLSAVHKHLENGVQENRVHEHPENTECRHPRSSSSCGDRRGNLPRPAVEGKQVDPS